MVPSLPSWPLEVCIWRGEGTAPSPAERLRATAAAGLCVINPGANPPVGAARQIKELTHLCLRAAAKGSWEESRAGVGESQGAASVLLIDKKGKAPSSERSPAPSKCSRRRRGKEKALLSLAGAGQDPAAPSGRGGQCPRAGLGERTPRDGGHMPRVRGAPGFAMGALGKVRDPRSTQRGEVNPLPHLVLQHQEKGGRNQNIPHLP